MVFSSFIFIFAFLPIALLGFWLIAKLDEDFAKAWLGLASVIFYGWWNPSWVPVLLLSILFNYCVGRAMLKSPDQRRSKYLMAMGIIVNLAALFYYKYFFAVFAFLNFATIAGIPVEPQGLPLGISFFTFTQIAFLVDISQGFAKEYRFLNYFLFVTFFPHLIVGPIVHHKDLMPQFEDKKNYKFQPNALAVGLMLFCIGLAKKTLIADNIGAISHVTLSNEHIGFFDAWLGVLTYSMQLYFDFAGYSDMAIGLARMFGIKFPLNFNSPYKATSIIDFWQRWHMTLTRFLTSYIYNPLALAITRRRAASGKMTTHKTTQTFSGFMEVIALPTMVTMVLAGIWHGAGLQYVVFGALHGFYITVNHAWRNFMSKRHTSKLPRPLSLCARIASGVLVFVCVLIAEVFFQAKSVHAAMELIGSMTDVHGLGLSQRMAMLLALVIAVLGIAMDS